MPQYLTHGKHLFLNKARGFILDEIKKMMKTLHNKYQQFSYRFMSQDKLL